jgi:hypothetical protein
MSRSALSAILAFAAVSKFAFAQPDPADPTPLVDKTYAYPSGIVSFPPSIFLISLFTPKRLF